MQQRIAQLEKLLNTYTGASKVANNNLTNKSEKIEYYTDEEELAKETEWVRKENRNKKRKMDTSLSPPAPHKEVTSKKHERKPKLPPPVVLEKIKDITKLNEYLTDKKVEYKTAIMNNDMLKINTPDSDNYRELIKALDNTDLSFHTYENKQERPIRVMVKKLHRSCLPDQIVKDLQQRGYKAVRADQKFKRQTKEPLDMFIITFRNDEDINKIFGITDVLSMRVEVQPLRSSRLVPQCKRCQAYGHTQTYCKRAPRCVKCAGDHLTKNCEKPTKEKPKCIHCGENHPASYRGCFVAKRIQQLRSQKINKEKSVPKPPQRPQATEKPKATTQKVTENRKFSDVVKNAKPAKQEKESEDTLKMVLERLIKMDDKLSHMDARLTRLEHSAKGAIPKSKNG